MVGVSLSPQFILEEFNEYGPAYQMLKMLQDQGVESIELRSIMPDDCPDMILQVANRLWDMGLQISVHGVIDTEKTVVEDMLAPLEKVLRSLRQPKLCITVHPTVWDNVSMLTAVSDHILANGLPVQIALENERLLVDETEGDSTAQVLAIVKKVDRQNIGICFDMGHYTYYLKKHHPDKPVFLPEQEFIDRVVHTHIHGMHGLTTHDPLTGDNLPLKEYLVALIRKYPGVYNFEPDFPRFIDRYDPLEAVKLSVDTLKDTLSACTVL